MIFHIIKQEWRILTRDSTAWIVLILFTLAVFYGIFTGASYQKAQESGIQKAQEEERARYEKYQREVREYERKKADGTLTEDDSWGPWIPAVTGDYGGARQVTLPPSSLAVLAIGQSDLYPNAYKISTRNKESFAGSDQLENPAMLVIGKFDLAFVILYLYPLMILALTFNLTAEEKESGTLSLLLSQPVALSKLIAGKMLARSVLVFLPAILFSVIGIAVGGTDLNSQGMGTRLLLWAAAVFLYGAFWFGLSILLNSLGKPAATNAMILAVCWLGFVQVIPTVANVLAATMYPVPSRVEFVSATRAETQSAVAKGSQLLSRYLEDHPELADMSKTGDAEYYILRGARDAEVARKLEPVLTRFDHQLELQQSLVNRFRFLSPAILMQDVLYELAGTGNARHKHFLALVSEFHAQWKAFFLPKFYAGATLTSQDIAAIPEFTYREEPLEGILNRIQLLFWSLALLPTAIGAFGFWKHRSFRVAD